MMKTIAAISLILMFLLSSCQTVGKREIELDNFNDPSMVKIKEWEEYMNVIDYKDFSADALVKLTEEYFRAKEMLYKNEMERYEKKLTLYTKGSLKNEPQYPLQNYSSLIKNFKDLIKEYPYGSRADAIRYSLGYALYTEGETDEAITVFADIVKNYRWSNYLYETSFRLGELYFITEQFGEALDTYKILLEFPDSVFYEKAIYKTGWVYYKLNEFEKAVELFMGAADREWRKNIKKEGFIEEIIHGIVLSLGHFKNMDQAVDYFKSKGLRNYTLSVFQKLGARLVKQTRYEEALTVFNSLTQLYSENNPALPFIYEKMADLYERIDKKEMSFHTKRKLVSRYNHTTDWYKKNYPDGSENLDSLISKLVVSNSKQYHLRGKEKKNLEDFTKAAEGYRKFMSLFPKSSEFKEINLLFAEALFDAKKYDQAGKEYVKAALLHPEGIQRGDISYSAFLAFEILFYQSTKKKEAVINSTAHVLKTFKTDFLKIKKLDKLVFRLADMYAEMGEFFKARKTLMPLVKGEKSINAYKKISEYYLIEGDLIGAEKVYSKMLNEHESTSMKEKLVQLRYRIAEDYLKSEKYEDSIVMYKKAFSGYPGYEIGEAALIKMGDIYILKKNLSALKRVVGNFVKVYPDSDGAVFLLVKAGQEFEKEKPLESAVLYEYASSLVQNIKDARKLLLSAGILYEKNSDYGKAEGIFKKYLLEKDISFKSRIDVLYKLGTVQLKRNKKKEGIKTYREVMKFKDYIDDQKIAKASLTLLNESLEKYIQFQLTQPFEKTFKKKTLLLNTILKEYSNIAKYKIADFQAEIFFKMGLALEHFKDSIVQSERPDDFNQDELEEYNFLLEEKAYPYDDQAVKTYERSVTAAVKNMIFDEWMEKSLKKLAFLRPALYKRELMEKAMELVFIEPIPVFLEN